MGLQIGWGKVDVQAKSNSNPSMSNAQTFSNVAMLKLDEGEIETIDYATVGELNQSVLDDSQSIIPDNPPSEHIVLWSKARSNNQGYFSVNPVLVVSFSDVVTSSGLTLTFWPHNNEYCREVKIRWYDVNNVLLDEKTFYPNSSTYVCSNLVEQYKSIQIEFVRTCFPGRFVKYKAIMYGEIIKLRGNEIVASNLVEGIGLTSKQLFTNQLECDIISLEDNFNIVTNPGKFNGLAINQQIDVADGDIDYGKYFIQESKVTDNIVSIKAFDLIGRLESSEFKGGLYNNATFATILNEIKTQANTLAIFDNKHDGFDVSASILSKTFTGYIPLTNCREALHQLCYAANVVANCMRGEKIKIFAIDTTTKETIDNTKIIMNTTSIEDNESYTGVVLNAFSYILNSEQKELENKQYEAGTHTITFTSPHANYTMSGGTITSSGANFVTFNVTTAGTVIINGYEYDEIKQQFISDNPSYTGNVPIRKELGDVKLVGPAIAQSVADKQLWYYKQKYILKSGVYNSFAKLADNVIIGVVRGQIQEIDTDLIAGDVCEMEVLANAQLNN